jgi:hypothetical protein
MKHECVRWLKGAKLYLEDALVIWMEQVNAQMEQQLMKSLRNKQKQLDSRWA